MKALEAVAIVASALEDWRRRRVRGGNQRQSRHLRSDRSWNTYLEEDEEGRQRDLPRWRSMERSRRR